MTAGIAYSEDSGTDERGIRDGTAAGLLIGILVCLVVLVTTYGVLIRTGWGQRLDVQAYFGRVAVARHYQPFNQTILDAVSKGTVLLMAVVIIGIGYLRRSLLVAVVTVLAWGGAVVGAEVFKATLSRPNLVPEILIDPTSKFLDNTYPSGHTTITTAFGLALVLLAPVRWRPWVGVGAGVLSAAYAGAVLFAGWHRPSDAIGAIAWCGFTMSIAAVLALWWRGKAQPAVPYPRRAVAASAFLAVALAAISWLVALNTSDELPDADIAFLWMTVAIVTCSFSVTAWFSWQLRSVDWVDPELSA
ncbi:MAG: phosphatase PAP2 family protein [Actinomycetes bacterium]